MKVHFSRLALFALLAVVLLVPMTASAKSPLAAHERPLTDFFRDDLNVNYYCPQQVPYLHTLMPWDFTTAWDLLPKGYYLAFNPMGCSRTIKGRCRFATWICGRTITSCRHRPVAGER